ncbi:MAG: hypothetical protein ACLGGV_03145 [Bacteroidia bacterium]
MKNLLITLSLILVTLTTFSQDYYPIEITYKDGTVKIGEAKFLVSLNDKKIFFKNNGEEEILSDELKSITYKIDGRIVVFDRLPTYYGLKHNKIGPESWLEVKVKGFATLYIVKAAVSHMAGGSKTGGVFTDFYCYREGEAAAKLISSVGDAANNSTFKLFAAKYFSDYPELSEKIKSKVYKYDQIIEVVEEYNKWKENK